MLIPMFPKANGYGKDLVVAYLAARSPEQLPFSADLGAFSFCGNGSTPSNVIRMSWYFP
jgi:hypothetical protein